jgi:hypothetical protein
MVFMVNIKGGDQMRFYSNVNKENRQLLFLEFSDAEARYLGGDNPLGTRLTIRKCNGDEKRSILAPDFKGRARLHRKRRSNDGSWEAVFTTNEKAFPISGLTPLVHNQIEGGYVLRPFDSTIVNVRTGLVKVLTRKSKGREHQNLPGNKPPIPELGVVTDPESEIRTAVAFINDAMDRLPDALAVDLRIENNRVRATLHVTI